MFAAETVACRAPSAPVESVKRIQDLNFKYQNCKTF